MNACSRLALAVCGLTLLGACSDAISALPDGAGGVGGGAGVGGASGTPAAVSGATMVATAGASGSAVGGGGAAAGGAETRGGAAGAGGSSGGGSAGSMNGGGAGGAGGTGGTGGEGGTGGGGLLAIAKDFDQLRLECPCIDADHFGLDKQDNCDAAREVDRQTHVKQLGGDPAKLYDVKLRVRGNTEPNTYTGGKLEQERFYIGGQTSTPGYTAYMLTVSEPQQSYFFNHNPTTGHIHFLIDYEVVIPMRGGATVTFEVNGGKSVPDGHGVSNRERLVVPGIAPAPEPFNGQLVQFDVVSVSAAP
jgi:hypothetical protein